jgi:hypothetical protein
MIFWQSSGSLGQNYFKVLDGVEVQFGDRFDQDSLNVLQKLKECFSPGSWMSL